MSSHEQEKRGQRPDDDAYRADRLCTSPEQQVSTNAVGRLIGSVLLTLKRIVRDGEERHIQSGRPANATSRRKPAVPVASSVSRNFIICLEDGKKVVY